MDYIIDAKGRRLGRLASETAVILQGKKNSAYEKRLTGGDRVIIKNIAFLDLNQKKFIGKVLYSHTGRIGRLKTKKFLPAFKKDPAKIFQKTVKNMLPKNRLLKHRLKKLVIQQK